MLYGASPFAQISFVDIASNIYPLSTTENLGSADSQVFAAGYASTATENIGAQAGKSHLALGVCLAPQTA